MSSFSQPPSQVLRAPSRPLDPTARAFFEPRFGHDLRRVRIHADQAAASSARAVGALAYTVGQHIVFGAGSYAPESDQGRKLLAHELTHVLQQAGGGPAPGVEHERDAEAAARAVQVGSRPRVGASSRVGLAAQSRPGVHAAGARLDGAAPEDRWLGIRTVTVQEIEAKVAAVIARPGWQVAQGRADFSTSPARAKASLYHTHFRDDTERLSYALGVFQGFLAASGDVDAVELFGMMVAHEEQIQGQVADMVLHTPPTEPERQRLSQLRQRRRTEIAAREAERVRQEAERAPEDISKFPCGDPKSSGPYSDQGLRLPYDKLVPDPDPRKGFDDLEVVRTLMVPPRFEQLYYDATHGVGKAAWLVCQFEWQVDIDTRRAVRNTSDITTFGGIIHTALGLGGYDFRRYGFSPHTASGKRMFTVYLKAAADEANDVRFTNTVINNLANLWAAGKLTEGVLPRDVDTPSLPTTPPETNPPTETSVPAFDPVAQKPPASDPHLQADPAGAQSVPKGQVSQDPPAQPALRQRQQKHQDVGQPLPQNQQSGPPRPQQHEPQQPGQRPQQVQQQQSKQTTGLATAEEDAIVQRYTRGLADLRARVEAVRTRLADLRRIEAKAPRARYQKQVNTARAAYDSANRQLQATDLELQGIEDEAVMRTGGALVEHLDPLTAERGRLKHGGTAADPTAASVTGARISCQALDKAPANLRGMDFADIETAVGRPPDQVEPARREAGGKPSGHQRLWWEFDDGSRLVIDDPRELGGRPRSADLPHAELHGPKGERLDQQGIVVPDDSISSHMTITDHTGALENHFGPARKGM